MSNLRIDNVNQRAPLGIDQGLRRKGSEDFASAVKQAVSNVNRVEEEGNRSIIDLLQGKAEVHETMIALQKADISMRLLLAIRNKVIEAYREISRMQF